jgi:thiol-disulfide isomerase/thioredoxin
MALACTQVPATVLAGTLVGHDGQPMAVAHVHAFQASADEPFLSVPVGSDGSFGLATAETGALMIRFSGTEHVAEDIPLYVDSEPIVEVDVRLATPKYVEGPGGVKALVKEGDDFTREAPLEQRADGTLTARVESAESELSYVLEGATEEGWAHGTDSEDYEYDPSYGYASVVAVDTGWAQISFDPSKLVEGSEPAEVRFRLPESRTARLYAVWREGVDRLRRYYAAQAAYTALHSSDTGFAYDWSDDVAATEAQLADERDPLLRAMLFLSLISVADLEAEVDPAAIQQALEEIPPTSLVWGYGAALVPTAVYLAGQADSSHPYAEYLAQVIDTHPSRPVRMTVLWLALWHADDDGDTAKAMQYYERLVTEFPESWAADWARARFAPDRAIMVGKPVPEFALTSLEDPETVYTRDGLLGKVYLIDFWATWCPPCIVELPNVHDAYEKYRDRGFEVLSVAMRDTERNIAEFRRVRWPMPWLHASYGWNDDAVAPFEIGPIPAAILVDRDGTIAAVDAGVRGERLHEALDRLLGKGR